MIEERVNAQREQDARRKELGASLVAQLPFFTDLGLDNNAEIIMALGRHAAACPDLARPALRAARERECLRHTWGPPGGLLLLESSHTCVILAPVRPQHRRDPPCRGADRSGHCHPARAHLSPEGAVQALQRAPPRRQHTAPCPRASLHSCPGLSPHCSQQPVSAPSRRRLPMLSRLTCHLRVFALLPTGNCLPPTSFPENNRRRMTSSKSSRRRRRSSTA